MKIPFGGRILILGCGAVSQCLIPMLLKHFEMDFSKITVMDFEDMRAAIPGALEAGAQFVQHRVTPDNLTETLEKHLSNGDLLIDVAWNIDTLELLEWCHDHTVLYINTSLEIGRAHV